MMYHLFYLWIYETAACVNWLPFRISLDALTSYCVAKNGGLLLLFAGVGGDQRQRKHRALYGGQHVVGYGADGKAVFQR